MNDTSAYKGDERRQGMIDLLAVHNTATEALQTIKFHMNQCDERQVRIEKSQDETKNSIRVLYGKIEDTAKDMTQKVADTNVKIDSGTEKTNDKINQLNVKVAVIFAVIMLLREIIVAMIPHHGN